MTTYDKVKGRLLKHVPDDDRTCLGFTYFHAGVSAAIGRAQGLSAVGMEHRTNPSTGVRVLAAKFDRSALAETVVGG